MRRLTEGERSEVLDIIQRRVEQRIPAAYLTHQACLGEFQLLRGRTRHRAALVHRRIAARTAQPVDRQTQKRSPMCLDLCTGSGCLAILAAHAFPNASVDAVDLSSAALAVAERNVADYRLQDRVSLVESDMFAKLDGKRYDLIISNPPYVDAQSVAALPQEYLHEPKLALGSGQDGLDATRIILEHAAQHLTENGMLVVEIGHNRDALEAAYPDLPFTWLDVSAGDQFVFLLHRNDLLQP